MRAAVERVAESAALARDHMETEAFDAWLRQGTKLHEHQVRAVRFAMALHPTGFILADDMGLGKTLSLLAYCSFLITLRPKARFLIIAPLSVAPNWMTEIERFTTLSVALLIGTAEERENVFGAWKKVGGRDVLVTTYEHAREPWVLSATWTLVAVDEGHRLQNRRSVLYKALFGLGETRVLLTGTPMQNKLDELFSLLHFVAPDVFQDADEFLSEAKDKDRLHSLLRVFMLRRLKKDVNLGLPPRLDVKVSCPLSALQRKVYLAALQRNWAALGTPATNSLSNVLMNLRKATAHPYLFDGVEPQTANGDYEIGDHIVMASGKLRVLDVLLRKFRREGKRVLVFSTMTRVLDILQDYLDWKQYPNVRLDGSVRSSDRTDAIDAFKNAESDAFVFLLSTRAGGVGLNLANATVVVFFDSDWNPMADMQAAARAHRIGQTEEVLVVRLVADGTVDELVVSRAQSKLALADESVDQGRGEDPRFSAKELLDIVSYGVADMMADKEDDGCTVTEADIDMMIEDARLRTLQGEEAAAKESKLKRAKTIRRIDTREPDENVGDMYEFEGKNWASERDTTAMQTIAEEGKKAVVAASPMARASTMSLAERGARSAERSRELLKALWAKNGYESKKVVVSEEEEQQLMSEEERELHHVVGDCTECNEGGNGRKIIVVTCNRSGVFSGSRFFQSVLSKHGREAIETAYAVALENKDLANGDCHIVRSTERSNCFVALCICIDKSGALVSNSLKSALRGLAAFARREPGTTIHCPHLQNWYASEKVLQSALCNSGCDCYVYYYQKPKQGQQNHSVTTDLPDFLGGLKVCLKITDEQLLRHTIAFGATIVSEPAEDAVMVTEEKRECEGTQVKPEWLIECFRHQQLIDTAPFIL